MIIIRFIITSRIIKVFLRVIRSTNVHYAFADHATCSNMVSSSRTRLMIRLARHGCVNRPFYHVVVMHQKQAPRAPVLEQVKLLHLQNPLRLYLQCFIKCLDVFRVEIPLIKYKLQKKIEDWKFISRIPTNP